MPGKKVADDTIATMLPSTSLWLLASMLPLPRKSFFRAPPSGFRPADTRPTRLNENQTRIRSLTSEPMSFVEAE